MYKIYSTGQQFLDENLDIIRNDPLGTIFFEENAKAIDKCNQNDFAVRVEKDSKLLLAIHVGDYPLVLYGSECCANELAEVVVKHQLSFCNTIGPYELSTAFLTAYEQLVGGSHTVRLPMDIMRCEQVIPCDTSRVERATESDANEIAQLVIDFTYEAVDEKSAWGEVFEDVSRRIGSYALLRADGKIVSIASGYDEDNGLCRLSNVYTVPQYRNKGYSRKVVTYVTEQALTKNQLPFLHVDKRNPVSNHLYLKVGYVYGKSRYEMEYRKTK